MSSTSATSATGVGGIGNIDIDSTDIETALMAVQTQRSNLLETQLKDQMSVVQQRNQQIEAVNQMLALVRQARPAASDGKAQLNDASGTVSLPTSMVSNTNQATPGFVDMSLSAGLKQIGLSSYTGKDLKQGDFDQLISTLTSKIDGLNSSQQMDMLRLQSLTNKRNEAFDLMTNFMKKMQESRSSILSNLR